MRSRIHRTWPLWIVGAVLIAGFVPVGTEAGPAIDTTRGISWTPPLPPTATAPATPEQGTALLARQPVAFVANLGQWDGDFSHKARMGPMTVFLQDRGWTFTLEERSQPMPDPFKFGAAQPKPIRNSARGVAVGMHFGNGAAPAIPFEEQRLPGVHNFFLGNDPDRWQSNVPLHGAVVLDGLYPGIDLRARSQDGHFEYDLLVEPGADLERVVVEVTGADGLRLDPDGTLIIQTALGPVNQPLPHTWQVDAFGQRQAVACRYVLRTEQSFGFEAAGWDPELALVVDPGLVYSTFLGGVDGEIAFGIAVNTTGGVTVCGETLSTNYPSTSGAYDTSHNGGRDVIVTQLGPAASTLVYSTFLGGWNFDKAEDIALDANGTATVVGSTSSTNFPTTPGAYDTTHGGNGVHDGFVIQLGPSGGTLNYSTFLGGTDYDAALGIAVDTAGEATLCGWTSSANFPTTPGAYDTTYSSNPIAQQQDAFVARINASGSALIYSTFLGGDADLDQAYAIALDATGAATVCGGTLSANFPTTPGAHDTTHSGGWDAFVGRIDASGSTLVYSTFLGDADLDLAYAIVLSATGTATVCGRTSSTNYPTTQGAYDTTHNGGSGDAFVTQLDASGSALIYSTFLGGGGNIEGDRAYDITLDAAGSATVCGQTDSTSFPTTLGAYDTVHNGGISDAFVARFDPTGGALIYSTFLGGADIDSAFGLALGPTGSVSVCGTTLSTGFPTTSGAYNTTFNGSGSYSGDVFVTRLDLGITIGISQPQGPGTPITIDNASLIPGNEYYNIFSLDLCPAGAGTGPYLGLCATTLANVQFLVLQASLPVGSPPFHFIAPGTSASWGPYFVGPGTLDAVCLDVTGGILGSYSPVTRITIQ